MVTRLSTIAHVAHFAPAVNTTNTVVVRTRIAASEGILRCQEATQVRFADTRLSRSDVVQFAFAHGALQAIDKPEEVIESIDDKK